MTKKQDTKGKPGRPATGRIRRHIVFDPDILLAIEKKAEKEGRNFSDQLNFMLRNLLKGKRK